METTNFLGRGPGVPLCYQGRGRFTDLTGEEGVKAAISLILMTAPGEDPMRPDFGCRVWELLFLTESGALAPLAAEYVREALARWEPRVTVTAVTAVPDDNGGYTVSLEYQTVTANALQNQTFTFNGGGGAS